MKILGGTLKGRNFYLLKGQRATQNMVRKAVFDILQDVERLAFLDLFSGTGAVGFEALSRGAKRVVFVERDQAAFGLLKENVDLLELSQHAERYDLMNSDVFMSIKILAKKKDAFDVIFIDAPYGTGLAKKALKTLEAYDIVNPNSFIMIQHDRKEILPQSAGRFLFCTQRKYGRTFLSIFQAS